nr:GDSL esterase/lipase At2g30220-like [Ipomoea batatas]
MAPSIFVFIFFVQFSIAITNSCFGQSLQNFPVIIIFGDSSVDTGNNNYILTTFKCDHPPYGQSFPGHIPTGRFSDGKLVTDFMASVLGLKDSVPPFLQPYLSEYELLTGVNFASGGSGFDELTTVASRVIPMSIQLDLFWKYIERLNIIAGEEEAQRIINQALVIISAGTNDFIFNYYDIPTRRQQFSISDYQDFLLYKLQNFIEGLYNLGCRTMLVSGLPPIGCLPIQMTAHSPLVRECLEEDNTDAQVYNAKLVTLLPEIQGALPGSTILYSDAYTPMMNFINDPQRYGFVETREGCCGTGLLEAGPLCIARRPTCTDSSQYLFWDSIHPSESAYRYITEFLLNNLQLHSLSHVNNSH